MSSEYSVILRAHEIGGTPRRIELAADDGQRAALASRFDLLALDLLAGTVEVRREARGISVSGRIEGRGAQACVASGEPVPFRVKEKISLLLVDAPGDGGEIELSADDLDVEPLDGDIIDVGELAAQALALALDPYPRKAGAVAGIMTEEEAVAARSPFAALKKG